MPHPHISLIPPGFLLLLPRGLCFIFLSLNFSYLNSMSFFYFFCCYSFTYISFSSPHPHTVMLRRRSERAAVWYLDAYQVLNYYICSTRCKNFQSMSKELLIPCVIRGTDSPSGNMSLLYVSWCMLTSHMIFQSRFAPKYRCLQADLHMNQAYICLNSTAHTSGFNTFRDVSQYLKHTPGTGRCDRDPMGH